MKRFHLLYPVFAVACVLCGCSSSSTDGQSSGQFTPFAKELLPLSVGNEWIYARQYFDWTGTTVIQTAFDTIAVLDTITAHSGLTYVLQETNYPPFYCQYENGGRVVRLYLSRTDTLSRIWLSAPLARGDSLLLVPHPPGSADPYIVEYFVDAPVPISVRSVVLNCSEFEFFSYSQIKHPFLEVATSVRDDFAPGIGIVRNEVYSYDGTGGRWLMYRDSLVSYTVK